MVKRVVQSRLTDVEGRLYRRFAARRTRSDRFELLGENSIVHPPALVIGPERIRVGRDVVIHPGAFFSVLGDHGGKQYDARLTIGDRARIGSGLVVGCAGSVEIGVDVLIADRVFIGDTYHDYRDVARPIAQQGLVDPRPVSIGSGAFLGVGSAVLPGVTAGEGAFVGANAVVT
ncbi:MAG: hypothetical protein H0U14_05360, partial [Thermoleophilaceae bacterium]|nr:hypothetical protein [Thermoleophilaceae bacterium]